MAPKNGTVAITMFLKQICQTITAYHKKIDLAIDAAVTGGLITAGDATTLKAWVDAADGICQLFSKLTGY